MRRPLVDVHGSKLRWLRALLGLLAGACLLQGRPAAAACTQGPSRWVALDAPAPAADDPVAWPEVVKHVESELRLRELELCTTAKASRPLARLRLHAEPPASVRIELWVDQPAPLKLAERTLGLGSVPLDARLLSVAVAADELLAANWSELEQRAAHQRAPGPREHLPSPPPSAPQRHSELGPGFVYESFDEGQTLLGVDARFRHRILTLRAGFRQGLPEQAAHGSVHTRAVLAGLGLRAQLFRSGRLKLGLLGRLDAVWLDASAYPDTGAAAHAQTGLAVVLSGGPELRVALSQRVWLALDATAGGALRPLHLTDSGQRVSGIGGLAFGLGGGVYVAF